MMTDSETIGIMADSHGDADVIAVPGESLQLDGQQGWIVTCGALYKGLSMTWTPGTGVVVSHRLVL